MCHRCRDSCVTDVATHDNGWRGRIRTFDLLIQSQTTWIGFASRSSNSARRLAPSESGSVRRTLPEESCELADSPVSQAKSPAQLDSTSEDLRSRERQSLAMSIDIPSARATLVALFAGQVQLGGPATPGPAQRVIVGLDADTARRLSLLATTAAGAGGVLVGAHDRGIHAHVPSNQAGVIGQRLQPGLTTPSPSTSDRAEPPRSDIVWPEQFMRSGKRGARDGRLRCRRLPSPSA